MPENPLLPHSKLKEMYALMQRLTKLAKPENQASRGLEAVLAAALVQLEVGDILFGVLVERELVPLAANGRSKGKAAVAEAGPIITTVLRAADTPMLSQALASGVKAGSEKNAVVGLTPTSASAEWQRTLKAAQTERLPLVLIFADETTPVRKQTGEQFGWPTLSRLAKKFNIPTVLVDGDDAVAIYRVLQESLHRAKHGDGPALVWCSYPAGPAAGRTARALSNMQTYLGARGLLPRKRKTAQDATQRAAAN